jgi:hypothetical protein
MGEPFTTACTRIEARPTSLYREAVGFMCNAVWRGGLEHMPGEYTVSREGLHGFPT